MAWMLRKRKLQEGTVVNLLSMLLLIMIINFKVDPLIFNDVYRPLLSDYTRNQIIFGGSSSGKSYFAVGQRPVWDILQGGRNFLFVRNVARYNRISTFNEITKTINSWNANEFFNIHKSDLTITCANGYQMLFVGLDDVHRVKSVTPQKGVITDIIVEEATETSYDDIKELRKRLRGLTPEILIDGKPTKIKKRFVLLFNPINRTHWIFKEYFAGKFDDNNTFYKNDDLMILKTTYKDNLRFLEQEDVDALEDEKDIYYHNVYTLGNWGVLGDLIYKNWRVEDIAELKNDFDVFDNGLDFGFTNDPTALSRSVSKKKILYIFDELYERGLTNDQIASKVKPIIGDEIVRCDSAEPKSIIELKDYGIRAIKAMKGPGSINYGIQYLKQFEILVDKNCQNFINEFSMYMWAKNKDGEILNIPIKKNDHLMDALRYGNSHRIKTKGDYTSTFNALRGIR